MKIRFLALGFACMTLLWGCNDIIAPIIPEIPQEEGSGQEETEPDIPAKPVLMTVNIQLEIAAEKEESQADRSMLAGAEVMVTSGEMVYKNKTGEDGRTSFQLPLGLYSVYASAKKSEDNKATVLNGNSEEFVVGNDWNQEQAVIVRMLASTVNQVIIKEMYTGGIIEPATMLNNYKDSYIKLYNNSGVEARLENFAMAVAPGRSNKDASTMFETINNKGEQCYADEDWVPLHQAVWYIQGELVIPPYSDIVIAVCGAINHKLTFPEAIDLSEADYVHYDPQSGMEQAYMYPAPSEKIPTSHYMKCVLYGEGFGWSLPIGSPALLIFTTHGMTPEEFAKSEETTFYPEGLEGDIMFRLKKLKRSWCIDAVEAFEIEHAGENFKRLTPDLDGSYIYQTWSLGHSVYRNVDKEATEAIESNKGKLVYNYSLGTEDIELGSTDPSNIDAEASIRNGASIIYMDTNNSIKDFHLRRRPSLKD